MGFHPPCIAHVKRILRGSLFAADQDASMAVEVQNGHFALYVGENQNKRFVISISYLNHPSFQELLSQAEDEFRLENPMGGLAIPCREDVFVDLISSLSRS